jgi:6,7-dimethyl-8-ribityllumazine synthase
VTRDIDESSEDVLSEWSRRATGEEAASDDESRAPFDVDEASSFAAREQSFQPEPERSDEPSPEPAAWGSTAAELSAAEEEETDTRSADAADGEAVEEDPGPMLLETSHEHAIGELEIPDGYAVLEGDASGARRAVGVVISRFNGGITSRLLESALKELDDSGVSREAITVMVVPGAFELPLAATALAKTRRFACVVALGCVIRGDTPHFDYVAGEAASGLQLAALETGVPVSFGVLTLDRIEQADARIEKGAEAVRTALEMADLFSHLRAAASR